LKAVRALDARTAWTSEDAWVIVQIDPREDAAEGLARLERFDDRSYGDTRLIFYRAG
jgi:16S rRNA G966 N2-methylase RsmD